MSRRTLGAKIAAFAMLGATLVSVCTEQAEAGTRTSTFVVRTNVIQGCTMFVAPLNFGTYVSNSSVAKDGQTTISLNCTGACTSNCGNGNQQTRIRMDQGLNPNGGNPNNPRRQMAMAGNRIRYDLYQDAARTTVWGSTGSSDYQVGGTFPKLIPVYGRIPAGQAVPPGTYQDTVTATVFY